MMIEVSAYELSADRLIVMAPAVSLDEGEVVTERGYPCWNPPCRRTVISVAINGVDFVGRPEPLVFYFYAEPARFFYLMDKEFWIMVFCFSVVALINALLTWKFRIEVYESYLRLKYKVKNKIVYPIMYKD